MNPSHRCMKPRPIEEHPIVEVVGINDTGEIRTRIDIGPM